MIVYDIRNLCKTYPGQQRPANKHIALQIHRGEIFGLLGENGAGKTTLIRQMVNLLRSTSGHIALFGKSIARNPTWVAQNVGYMPQEAQALNRLTVGEALFFSAHLRGMSRVQAKRERDAALDLWHIADLRDRNSEQLSGGQRRLLRLAVAMARALPVLILDEPTNDLDPLRRRLVWDVLRRVNRERGTTIVFVIHDAIEAEKIIERVGIMRDGELVAVGKPSDLRGLCAAPNADRTGHHPTRHRPGRAGRNRGRDPLAGGPNYGLAAEVTPSICVCEPTLPPQQPTVRLGRPVGPRGSTTGPQTLPRDARRSAFLPQESPRSLPHRPFWRSLLGPSQAGGRSRIPGAGAPGDPVSRAPARQ